MSQTDDAASTTNTWIGRHRRNLLIGGPIAVVVIALVFYLTGGRYVSTDDAYVQAARAEISTNVSGRVSDIYVTDNQFVRRGKVLLKLDQRRFLIAVSDAQAQLADARMKIPSLVATYRQRVADQQSAQSALVFQQTEYARQVKLEAAGISSSRAQLDQAARNLDAARQEVTSTGQETASALADVGGSLNIPVDAQPSVRQAQAALDRAKLDLSYTIVHAPSDGVVTKVEQLQRGDFVNAASPLFALISQKNMWVEANFKETDLTYMRVGQHASFSVDAYPGKTFTGVVQSTSPGTGSAFSLLPPENSSGNWVKVVQRLPVRLSIDPNKDGIVLASGMSVDAEIDTEHRRSIFFWN